MELRLPLEMSPGREAACRAVFGTWGFFPNDARKNCPFVLTAFTGWSSERCQGIGFLSRGDREIAVLRNVEPPTRPRLECRRETGHHRADLRDIKAWPVYLRVTGTTRSGRALASEVIALT